MQAYYVCFCVGFPSTPYPTESVLGQFRTRVLSEASEARQQEAPGVFLELAMPDQL